jgi:hypothetical protein
LRRENSVKRPARVLVIGLLASWGSLINGSTFAQQEREPIAPPLIDYRGFPEGWDIRGDRTRAQEVYTVREEAEGRILVANVAGEPIRIFKKIGWDPFSRPVLSWRWRVLQWPESEETEIQLYVSLDRDLLGIPKIEKYIWTRKGPAGVVRKGGLFSANEMVIRSGPSEEWVAEEINVLDLFRRFHGEDPASKAVGIGLQVGTGIEMEISEVSALPALPRSSGMKD